jgi:magnesium chelatase family protein
VRRRVAAARTRQLERFAERHIFCNARMSPRELRRHCALDDAGERVLEAAIERLDLSARSYGRVLRIARTIADLSGDPRIQSGHVAEAVQYRPLEALP